MAIQTRGWQVVGLVAVLWMAWGLTTAGGDAGSNPGANPGGNASILELEDGREIQGRIISDNAKEVVVDIAGVQTVFARDSIKAIRQVKSVEQQYRERRAAIADDDLDQRYELARWLFEHRSYDLARRELEALIEKFPADGRLVPLQNLIDARVKLLEAPPASQEARPRPAAGTSGESAASQTASGQQADFEHEAPADRLTEKDIQLIRVYEVDPKDRPNVHVPNEVMEDVYKRYAGETGVPHDAQSQRRMLGSDGWRKLDLLFSLRAREQYGKVTVHHDPPALMEFRTNIHNRYVLTYCATNACHGGKEAGDLYLFRFQPASNATVYTNYYILHQYRNAAGYMVDRQKPDRSLLVQYGMSRAAATTPHPDVPGWRPMFRDLSDTRAAQLVQWVQRLGVSSVPYPISYTIPKMSSPKAGQDGSETQTADQADGKDAPADAPASPPAAPAPAKP